ncbi:MAG TPA: class I poly(R)-hydroxyalkanoic acid synthase, partial [Alphaproteobacteria bacterium]|nr:class I poly(R)-hydroxyalkanoic acid synthase [Alphaproteobacteria bacterium]
MTGNQMDQQAPDNPGNATAEFARNMVKVAERSQKLISEFARSQMNGGQAGMHPELAETGRARSVADAFIALLTNLAGNQRRMMQAQHALLSSYFDLWQSMTKRLLGEDATPVIEPARTDKRFRGEEWTSNVVFDYIKQSYLLTANWLLDTVRDVEGLDPHQARLVEFHTRQFV